MFEKIVSEEKRFDVRLEDINVNKGDSLVLKESVNEKTTGRIIKKKVGFNTCEKSPIFRLEFFVGDFSQSSPNHSTNPNGLVILKTKDINYWSQDEINKFGLIVMQLED